MITGCCRQVNPSSDDIRNVSFQEKAMELFDTGITIIPNTKGDVAIIYQGEEKSNRNPIPTLSVILFNKETEEVLFRTSLLRGHVKWINNEEVHFSSTPGQVSRDGETGKGYTYHVYNKKLKK